MSYCYCPDYNCIKNYWIRYGHRYGHIHGYGYSYMYVTCTVTGMVTSTVTGTVMCTVTGTETVAVAVKVRRRVGRVKGSNAGKSHLMKGISPCPPVRHEAAAAYGTTSSRVGRIRLRGGVRYHLS